jgi:hypothetical protein
MRRLSPPFLLALALATWPTPAGAFDHAKLDGVLHAYVADARVDYDGLRAHPAELDAYLAAVAKAPPDEPLAFWLDAYDALVLHALATAPALPAKVTDLPGFFDKTTWVVAGKARTLNEIETLLRTTFHDPRVHFALNCGARSCPPLPAQAFPEDPAALDRVLDRLTSSFLGGAGVRIDNSTRQVQVTRLMDWYGADFTTQAGSLDAYLRAHVTDPARATALRTALDAGYTITFQPYDWTVNGR